MKTVWIVAALGLLIITSLRAQNDSLTAAADSMELQSVEQALSILKKADSIRLADSMTKVVLRKQLDELRTSEHSKRAHLEEELRKVTMADSLQKLQLKQEVDGLRQSARGYPIVPNKDTLFLIYTKIGSVTPQERARIIRERLQELYATFLPSRDSLVIESQAQTADLYFKDKLIISITDMDAMWYNQPKKAIARDILNRISADIPKYRKERSIIGWVKKVALSLLVIALQVLLIKLINWTFRTYVNRFIEQKRGTWFQGIKIKDYEILNADRQTESILMLVKLFRFFVIGLLLYITIPIVFSIFPLTKRLAETLFGYTLTPLKNMVVAFIEYLPELFSIIVIVTVTRYIVRFLRFLSAEIAEERLKIAGFFPDWARPTFNILRIFIYAFVFVVIFPYLPGSDSEIFKGVSVFLGIVFSLGSSSVIGNMVAGLVITYMRPFKIGDRIKIGDVVGNVMEKTPFVTRIRTPKKEFITIPNSNILSSSITNYSNSQQQGGLIVHTTVTIGYDVPWRQVHQLLMNAAKKTSYLNHDIAPFVLQTSLDDFYVSYQLNAHTNDPDRQPAIYSELHQHIQDAFTEAGIEIMSPHYRADRDGNALTIPVRNGSDQPKKEPR